MEALVLELEVNRGAIRAVMLTEVRHSFSHREPTLEGSDAVWSPVTTSFTASRRVIRCESRERTIGQSICQRPGWSRGWRGVKWFINEDLVMSTFPAQEEREKRKHQKNFKISKPGKKKEFTQIEL